MLIYLPGGSVASEKCEVGLEPVVDLVESQLPAWGLVDGLPDQRRVGEGRPHVCAPVKLPGGENWVAIWYYWCHS